MTTLYKLLTISFFLTVLGCNNQSTNKQVSSTDTKNDCKPYFSFDNVEHYYLDISEEKVWEIEERENKTDQEQKQLDLLIQDIPDKLSDTTILKDIEKIGFIKTEIPTDKFELLNRIFCERKHKEAYATACIAVYRDILVFKNENKIIGTTKVCFECDQSIITGTTLDTGEFGQSGDYGKLYKILH